MRLCLIWLCALLAGSVHGAMAQPVASPWGLSALMQSLAQVHAAKANFTECKTVQVLNAPLLVSGTLTYVAPDYVRKTTLAPVPEDFVLDHGEITMSGGADNQTHKFAVADAPQISGLVEGIRATLAGDLPSLARYYTVQFSGTETAWQLYLRPKNAGLAHFVKWMIIQGSQNRITTIDTASSNGDHSEMGITEDVGHAP